MASNPQSSFPVTYTSLLDYFVGTINLDCVVAGYNFLEIEP